MEKPHGNLPCNKEINKSMVEYSKNNFVKKCPKCNIITEKITGCNHITCAKCNYQWCWLCNGEYDPEHFYEGKCKGLQFFRPKDENEIKLAYEGKIDLRRSQMQDEFLERDENENDDLIDNIMIQNNEQNNIDIIDVNNSNNIIMNNSSNIINNSNIIHNNNINNNNIADDNNNNIQNNLTFNSINSINLQ